jgi:DNA-binding transcriptional ArsR family regulator
MAADAPNGWEKFWGREVWAEGFVALPLRLLSGVGALGLDGGDLALVAHLLSFARPGSPPWPSVATLAERLGLKRRQVQRRLARLEEAGLVKRVARLGKSTAYDLGGLAIATRALQDAPGTRGRTPLVLHDAPPASSMTPEEEGMKQMTKQMTTGRTHAGRVAAAPARRSLKLTPEENRLKQLAVDYLHQRVREFTGLAEPPGYSDAAAARFFAERARAGDTAEDFRGGIDEYLARLKAQAQRARDNGREISPCGSFAYLKSSWGSILRALVERRRREAHAAHS